MTPPEAAAARTAARAPERTRRAPDAPARPDLRVIPPAQRRRARARRRRPVTALLCGALLLATLLAVVVGHAVLTEGQLHLTSLQNSVAAGQAQERSKELSVARLETPSRIVHQAEQQDHMAPPAQVGQVPSVPLHTPLAAPTVAGTPGATSTATTTTPAAGG